MSEELYNKADIPSTVTSLLEEYPQLAVTNISLGVEKLLGSFNIGVGEGVLPPDVGGYLQEANSKPFIVLNSTASKETRVYTGVYLLTTLLLQGWSPQIGEYVQKGNHLHKLSSTPVDDRFLVTVELLLPKDEVISTVGKLTEVYGGVPKLVLEELIYGLLSRSYKVTESLVSARLRTIQADEW